MGMPFFLVNIVMTQQNNNNHLSSLRTGKVWIIFITLDLKQMTIIHNEFQVNVTKWLDLKIRKHEHVIMFNPWLIPH
jgi:hypothetical protein